MQHEKPGFAYDEGGIKFYLQVVNDFLDGACG